ncbi:hypothetical protein [Cesiribacter andamanensis]|uniref:Preprotein translocase subunit SecB n=1 Tax=Cesiribacter andamanensis AMV16 TaxID=1279009 RepID=M7N0S4_9BACT|nr:hypothetical protein [Cesiribacter andamanensis]EMR00801.1 hypothetical protein ADICEAN_04074 [Cesiribacter andamanensis AMV16]
MRAQPSPLKLFDFSLLELQYSMLLQEEIHPDTDLLALFDQYPIDVEFEQQHSDNNHIELFIKVEVNLGRKPLPGLQLLGVGLAVFDIPDAERLAPALLDNLRHFSTLSICINCMRSEFSNATANCPLGRYILPSLDVGSLLVPQKAKTVKPVKKAHMKVSRNPRK